MPKTTRVKAGATSISSVPYARGYKPPSRKRSRDAITHPQTSGTLPVHFQPTEDIFHPVPPPTSIDDWLAQYNESGQTYTEFLHDCPWLSKRKWKQAKHLFIPEGQTIKEKYPNGRIYLLKLDDFQQSNLSSPSFESLLRYVEIFYELPVIELDGIKLHQEADKQLVLTYTPAIQKSHEGRASLRQKKHLLETRYNKGHMQLRVQSVLTTLKMYIPNDAFFVMALTMYDLYESPSDLFVAGMAAGNHRVGVFSFYRYHPLCSFSTEFWYDVVISRKEDDKDNSTVSSATLLLQRSCKLLVHEIAHLLGVDHCIWYECCMNGSGHLSEDFRQPMFLCPVDLRKLQTLCGFDVATRYQAMKKFFDEHGFVEESKWLHKRLEYLLGK